MLRSFRQSARCGLAAVLSLSLLASGIAQAYPDQPIKIIVAFPPGGSSDIVIRALQAMSGQGTNSHAGNGGRVGVWRNTR